MSTLNTYIQRSTEYDGQCSTVRKDQKGSSKSIFVGDLAVNIEDAKELGLVL